MVSRRPAVFLWACVLSTCALTFSFTAPLLNAEDKSAAPDPEVADPEVVVPAAEDPAIEEPKAEDTPTEKPVETDPATEQPAEEKPVSFYKEIVPILQANCYGCHQPAKSQGKYDMTSFAGLLKGGATELEAVVPGAPAESNLLELIVPMDGETTAEMPKGKPPLHETEVALIRTWITQGAKDDTPENRLAKYGDDNPPLYSRQPVITSLDVSPNGELIAIAGFHEILLVNPEGELVSRLIGMSERINAVQFDPSGKRLLATGGLPARVGEIQVWDVDSQKLLLSKTMSHDTLFGGKWSPDGTLISFGCTDNSVRAINAETGEQVLFQGAHDDWVRDTVFSHDGSHLVSAGRDMTCKLTEVATERFVDNITSITPGVLKGGVGAVARHPERDEIIVGSADGIPKVYRIHRLTKRVIGDDANLIRQYPPMMGRIQAVAVSADGKRIVAGSALAGKGAVHVYSYDFDTTLPDDLKKVLEERVAARTPEQTKMVEDYRQQGATQIAAIPIESSGIYAVAFFPDGSKIASAGSDGIVRIYETETGKLLKEFSPAPITSSESESSVEGALAFAEREANVVVPEKLRVLTELKSVQVEPAVIELDNVHDYVQLLVSATLPSGDVVDVTRQVQGEWTAPIGSMKVAGLIQPLQNGETTLTLTVANQTVQIPVKITGMDTPFASNFIRDVNPILTKMGCNQGTCHGADKGKNGFKLSLRGYDPEFDVRTFTDDLASRRTNVASPDNSLMLLKATGAVPHVGGQLMTPTSPHYHILRTWIANGAQLDMATPRVAAIQILPYNPVIQEIGFQQQFRVVATYADGSTRDVTREAFLDSGNTEVAVTDSMGLSTAVRRGEAPILARYEGAYAATTVTVMGNRSGFEWEEPETFNEIDKLVAAKWERLKIKPAPLASDETFFRRVYLDLTGLPPTADQVRAFLADNRPSKEKRTEVINQLIGSEEYVEYWTNKWGDMLQVNRKFLGEEGSKAFRGWIRSHVEKNTPYDEFAREIITATGSNKENPAASYFKILRTPEDTMENTTHLFMAVRFNCNKCHDHPFERWTQDQYYETAAFFSQVNLARDPNSGDRNIGGTAVEGAKPLFEIVSDNMDGKIEHVRTGNVVEANFPFEAEHQAKEDATNREELASWITSADNQYFAKSYVNRLWGYMTGTGVIEPIDDIRAGNPPSNPELLDYLTQEFVDSGFDVRHVLQLICESRTYQLSIETNEWNEDDQLNYSHAKARRLPAEVLFDSIHFVTGSPSNLPGVEPGIRAAELVDVGVKADDGFLNTFGRPSRESACECERVNEVQLGPVMALISGPTVGNAISNPENAISKLVKTEANDARLVNELFLRILNRPADVEEVAAVLDTYTLMEEDHAYLQKMLAEREIWWKENQPKLEAERQAAIDEANAKLKAYEAEIATKVEQQKKEQAGKVAQLEADLNAFQATLPKLTEEWAANQNTHAEWFVLDPSEMSSTNKANLVRLPDRSIRASGNADKGTYVVNVKTKLTGITGIRVEALTLENGLTGKGPGLSNNGNFVITEFETFVAPIATPEALTKVALANPLADVTQGGFDANQMFDGNTDDQKGWAVSPYGTAAHWFTVETQEPIGNAEGSLFQFKLHQNHEAQDHRLGRFRISFTTDTKPIGLSLTEELKTIVSLPPDQRTEEQTKSLVAYFTTSNTDLENRRSALAQAKAPLPEDPGVTERRKTIELVSNPVPLDGRLTRLREDVHQSIQQQTTKRLTVAQDLAWALINNPSFLFNR
ncbi:WD domain, G-beta repeat [Polystyrenella longa]|uniref:WD domain, G-beta repeat n=1 Tax=Polystyrenella longa TaxID=2528007 RepID=A0A518CNS2_9PLAN|nr:DUF1549 domain-containing protein [Polystyrenella longa]QDU80863.1 WD domain, G-beta repeat [Polystyrenella longa]